MIAEAFDLVGNIIKLSNADQKLISVANKSWAHELELRALNPRADRPRL